MTNPHSFLSHEFVIELTITLISVTSGLKLLLTDLSHLWDILADWRVIWEQEKPTMDTSEILNSLKSERDRIDAAIVALEGTRGGTSANKNGSARGGRRMSAAARRKISLAQKKRWAEQKKAAAK